MQERPSFLQLQIAAHAFPAARQRQLITFMRVGGNIYIRRGVLISCLPQCHLQLGAMHVKKQVGAIRRKIANLAWPSSLFTGYTSHLPWVCLVSGRTVHKIMTVQPPEGPIAWRLPPRGHGRERGNCDRHRVYLPAHSDGRTTTAAPTGAHLLVSIVCSTSHFG